MTLILTGSPTRYGEDRFTDDNGFLATVKAELADAVRLRKGREDAEARCGRTCGTQPRLLMVSAAPDDVAFTDSVLEGMSLCVRNSGITPASITMLDRRN